jgi:hypothetical protein
MVGPRQNAPPRPRNGVNPQRHFSDMLTRLVNGWMGSRIGEIMPWRRAPAKNS